MKCVNCDGHAHADHNDLCCTCFCIAFGAPDHHVEHVEANRVASDTWQRNTARAALAESGLAGAK